MKLNRIGTNKHSKLSTLRFVYMKKEIGLVMIMNFASWVAIGIAIAVALGLFDSKKEK